ncbi:MAG: AsmA-like C-terminal domain-containing protein [Paracoccaceae bacterium]
MKTGGRIARRSPLVVCCRGLLVLCGRTCLALFGAALLGLGLLYASLSERPLALPELARLLQDRLNAEIEGSRIEIGSISVSLAGEGLPLGLAIEDVRVIDETGTVIMAAPRLVTSLRIFDLLRGRVRPTRIALVAPEARIVRAYDGRVRFGLGRGRGVEIAPPAPDGSAPPQPGMDAVALIIRGFVGDEAPVPQLARLEEIAIIGANLVYRDAVSGRTWRTTGSDLRIWRTETGARGSMSAALSDDVATETRVQVAAEREAGTGVTDLTVTFVELQPDDLAEQLTPVTWVRLFDMPLSGRIEVSLGPAGTIRRLSGQIGAAPGALLAFEGDERRFDGAEILFSYEPARRRMAIERLDLRSKVFGIGLSGTARIVGEDPLNPDALDFVLEIDRLRLAPADMLSEEIAFDEAQVVARLDLPEGRVPKAEVYLAAGDLVISATAEDVAFGPDGPMLDLTAQVAGATVDDVKRLWPLDAAKNARDWVVEHLVSGVIPALTADLRFAGPEPRVHVHFTYRDLVSRYLGDLPPITDGRGQATLLLHEFHLSMEEGRVTPPGAASIRIGPSRVEIRDLNGRVTPADIRLRGSGPTRALLALIDQEPLGLVSKLGLDVAAVGGTSEVSASLGFPLIQELLIEDIAVGVDARLTDVSLPLALSGVTVPISADALDLRADVASMTISGPVQVDGAALEVSWREDYGAGADHRRIDAAGEIRPEHLAKAGLSLDAWRSGTVAARASLRQEGGSARLSLDADLTGAEFALAPVRWEKPAGAPGRLELEGRLGDGTRIERFALSGEGLDVAGSVALDADGNLARVVLDRLALAERADLRAEIRRGADGIFDVDLGGRSLDLSDFMENPADDRPDDGTPVRIRADIARLRLSPKIVLAPVRGTVSRDRDGRLDLSAEGAAGTAPFTADYSRDPGRPGVISVRSSEAGGFLRGLGLFYGGTGGALTLDAAFKPDPSTDLSGTAEITDMTVRDATTFGSILEEGGVQDAAEQVETGGLRFRQIKIPFSYTDGVIDLDEAFARSPAIALKVDGIVEEAADRLDLSGVISPAYAVSGALGRIPLLGDILTGGEAEGILAMTFQVTGSIENPDFAVNPLSVLTPGILRGIFSGRASKPSAGFIDRLGSERTGN